MFIFRAKNFVIEIKTLIKEAPAAKQLIALDLLDYVVVECGLPLHTQISSKDFITFMLTLLKTKDSPDVQFKILILIKKWGIRFENKRDVLPNFYETYNSLKINRVVFPENLESTYYQYLNSVNVGGIGIGDEYKGSVNNIDSYPDFSNFSISENKAATSTNKTGNNSNSNVDNFSAYSVENNYGTVRLDLNPEKYPKKYRKFVGELVTLLNYIALSNVRDMIFIII